MRWTPSGGGIPLGMSRIAALARSVASLRFLISARRVSPSLSDMWAIKHPVRLNALRSPMIVRFKQKYVLVFWCAYCKTKETDLYEDGSPICLKCAELGGRGGTFQTSLAKTLAEARLHADSAFQELIMNDIHSEALTSQSEKFPHREACRSSTAFNQQYRDQGRKNKCGKRQIKEPPFGLPEPQADGGDGPSRHL
jgi:hypothetical protein